MFKRLKKAALTTKSLISGPLIIYSDKTSIRYDGNHTSVLYIDLSDLYSMFSESVREYAGDVICSDDKHLRLNIKIDIIVLFLHVIEYYIESCSEPEGNNFLEYENLINYFEGDIYVSDYVPSKSIYSTFRLHNLIDITTAIENSIYCIDLIFTQLDTYFRESNIVKQNSTVDSWMLIIDDSRDVTEITTNLVYKKK